MTLSVAHTFQSAKAQSADASVVSKNEWNAVHTLSMATGMLVGRTTAGDGTFEEITPSSVDFTFASSALSLGSGIISTLATDFTGADTATAQPVFRTTQDAFTDPGPGTNDYTFDAFYHIVRSAGNTSHTTSLLFAGTATISQIRYLALISNPTGNTLSAVNSIVGDVATAVVVTAANTSTTENLIIRLVGALRTNTLAGAGTIIPQFKYSAAPGGAPIIKADSFFRLRKLGDNTFAADSNWA